MQNTMECIGITAERHNLHKTVNDNGYKLTELCKGLDMKIVNGWFGYDQGVGKFTYKIATGKSVVHRSLRHSIHTTFPKPRQKFIIL